MAEPKSSRSKRDRRDPLVGVDLDDCERIDVEGVRHIHRSPRVATSECEALRACRNDR